MFRFNPITVKRFRRFRAHRRAWFSFLCLAVLYLLSLCAELLCNDSPLIIRHNGKTYFPVFKFYPDNEFTGSGLNTRTDYKKLSESEAFAAAGSWMLWPLLRTGPNSIVTHDDIKGQLDLFCTVEPVARVCGFSVESNLSITRMQGADFIFEKDSDSWKGKTLDMLWTVPEGLASALKSRFANTDSPEAEFFCHGVNGIPSVSISLVPYKARARAPRQVRMTARIVSDNSKEHKWTFKRGGKLPVRNADSFLALPDVNRKLMLDALVKCAESGEVQRGECEIDKEPYSFFVEAEVLRYPFRPVSGHWLGLDDAGRDVFARLLYALRTSLSFGLILVCCSMFVGACVGMIQGFCGGWVDLSGQRLIEIWSALPFLYIVILIGSIYGPGFWLMILCYALFNWIGISYYMRAEMLRLRRLPFVEAAKCLGLSAFRIVFRHALPNALVPIITFFPFSLVGAIGSLAALDYLGFGLPPPTPSIGQLLQQAQSQRWAWWLILYPSMTLFCVMLLGVFVGEGVREAFDPRRQGRLE